MTTASSPLHRALAPVVSGSTWRTTLKVYFDLVWMPLAAAAVIAPAVGAGVTIILVPIAAILASVALVANRLTSRLDRVALATFLDLDVPSPHAPLPTPQAGRSRWHPRHLWRLFTTEFTDRATWRAIGYRVASLPVTAIAAVATTLVWALSLVLLASPLWIATSLPDNRWGSLPRPLLAAAGFLAGLGLLVLAPWVIRQVGRLLRWTARLVGPRSDEALAERIEEVEHRRARVVDAAEAERRRIERDLHDGAQQRLVALAMHLGMAKERYDRDPEGTRALLDEAHAEAKRAMVELRDLARGVHPAVLTDRGLGPALSAVAARSAVPVSVDVAVTGRLDETTEGIAYFVACEALANVAKHSRATEARVVVRRRGDRLVLEVTDDGIGGAVPTGSGLQGLKDRVEGVDGWFHVASPPGGPTTLLVELPCAS